MPYRVFVSSTYEDLKEHREQVLKQVQKAGLDVVAMEHWTATPSEPKEFSRERVEGCDVCVLIVGLRRGFVPQGETRSITQMEFDEAIAREIPVLVFLVSDNATWPSEFDERDSDEELCMWRRNLRVMYGVEYFEDDPQSLDVSPAIARWIQSRQNTVHQLQRKEVKRRIRKMKGHFNNRHFFSEINGLHEGVGERTDDVSTWRLERLIAEGWGEDTALACGDLDELVLSEKDRAIPERVREADLAVEKIMDELEIG